MLRLVPGNIIRLVVYIQMVELNIYRQVGMLNGRYRRVFKISFGKIMLNPPVPIMASISLMSMRTGYQKNIR